MNRNRTSKISYYRSFTRNMVLIVILVSLAPMLLISGIILEQFHVSYHEKVYAHLNEMVHKHTQNIDGFLNERLKNIQFLSETRPFEKLFDESILREKLVQLQQKYGGAFEDLGIIDEEGVQISYAGPFKLKKARYSEAKWFNVALENPYYISDVFLGLRSRPHFNVSVRRVHRDRYFLLRATINFEAFNTVAENLRIGETGFAFILNKAGAFQTKPHYDMPPIKKSYKDFIDAGKRTSHGIYVGEHTVAADSDGFIYFAAPLKNEDWLLVYQQEKAEAFSDLRRIQLVAGLIIVIGALLIVLMNVMLYYKVVNRIAKADREKEMMNRRVIETGKLASAGRLAAVGRLAVGIAHEINNPVAIMVEEAGWIRDLLEEEEFEKGKNLEEIQRALKQIGTQGKRCGEITHNLLSFARKTHAKKRRVMINEIIEEVVKISTRSSYTGITIHSHLDKRIPPIHGSQAEIQQVFLNLINNALFVLEKDGGKIHITSLLEDRHVLVVVEDDGPGIPEADLDRIFDPFFTTKPVGKGYGLGLSICFGIIDKMGGEIDVRGAVGAGTRFGIRIPLKKTVDAPAAERLSTSTSTDSGG